MASNVLKHLRVDASQRRGFEDSSSWAEKREVWIPDEKQGVCRHAGPLVVLRTCFIWPPCCKASRQHPPCSIPSHCSLCGWAD
jgi:hypothetical protein